MKTFRTMVIVAFAATVVPARFAEADAPSALSAEFHVAQVETPEFEKTEPPEVTLEGPETLERVGEGPGGPLPPSVQPPSPEPNHPDWWEESPEPIGQAMDAREEDAAARFQFGTLIGNPAVKSLVESVFHGLIILLIVFAVILLCAYAIYQWGKRTPLPSGASLGTVLGTIHLSPKASLHFVRVGQTVLVVGLTPAGMTTIAQLEAALFNRPAEPPKEQSPTPLRPRVLDYPKPAERPHRLKGFEREEDEIAALKGDLARLQRYLQETSRELAE